MSKHGTKKIFYYKNNEDLKRALQRKARIYRSPKVKNLLSKSEIIAIDCFMRENQSIEEKVILERSNENGSFEIINTPYFEEREETD